MKRVLLPLLLVVALLGVAVVGYWTKQPLEAQRVACANPLAGCPFTHRGEQARLTFSSQPAPMEPFDLRVTAAAAKSVSAEFQMVGMDMGFNRYDLHRAAANDFTAQVTLPACVSGRRDWILTLEIDGSRYAIPFQAR